MFSGHIVWAQGSSISVTERIQRRKHSHINDMKAHDHGLVFPAWRAQCICVGSWLATVTAMGHTHSVDEFHCVRWCQMTLFPFYIVQCTVHGTWNMTKTHKNLFSVRKSKCRRCAIVPQADVSMPSSLTRWVIVTYFCVSIFRIKTWISMSSSWHFVNAECVHLRLQLLIATETHSRKLVSLTIRTTYGFSTMNWHTALALARQWYYWSKSD